MNAKDQAIEQANAQDGFPVNRTPTMFDVVTVGLQLLNEVEEADGELSDELAAKLDAHLLTIETKAEAYKAFATALTAEAEACDRFATVYAERAKRKRAHVVRLKARLKEAFEALGITSAMGKTGGAALQRNPPGVELLVPEHEAPEKLPPEYIETRVVVRKDAIKAALQAGATFDFARLTQSTHLRFR